MIITVITAAKISRLLIWKNNRVYWQAHLFSWLPLIKDFYKQLFPKCSSLVDETRVKLDYNGTPYSDYINANYIDGYCREKAYIATQGPLKTTINDFWRLCWEQNVFTVVMMTKCEERGRVSINQIERLFLKLFKGFLLSLLLVFWAFWRYSSFFIDAFCPVNCPKELLI